MMEFCGLFTHILQGYFTGIEAIMIASMPVM